MCSGRQASAFNVERLVCKMRVAAVVAAICVSVVSCADSQSEIASAQAVMVLSYEGENSKMQESAQGVPLARSGAVRGNGAGGTFGAVQRHLCVCLQMNSDVRRVESITLVSPDGELEWIETNPITIENQDTMYALAMSFVPPDGEEFASGEYKVLYMDAKGSQAQCPIVMDWTESKGEKERIALYDKNGTLLYYGEVKGEWKEDERAMWQEVTDAVKARKCMVQEDERGNAVIRLMGARYKED